MNQYLSRKYISPETIWAQVKVSLKSYFESGALDDLLFPIWTTECIQEFRRAAYPLKETYLRVENNEACLPKDFKYVHQAWICGETFSVEYQNPSSCYYQEDCVIYDEGDRCNPCSPCQGDTRKVVHKVTNHEVFTFTYSHLLSPGTVKTKECCLNSPNISFSGPDKFDIRDGKIITNLTNAGVYLSYYSDYEQEGIPLIEDNFQMKKYVKSYLMYRCMEYLMNNQTDDTFNQIFQKYQMYKAEQASDRILADIESKKQTLAQQREAANKTKNRYNNYRLPNDPNYRY